MGRLMPQTNQETAPGKAGSSLSCSDGAYGSRNLFSQQSGFGSPIPVLPAGSAVPGKNSGGTVQLTIFYGGMVNVYDDIPAHKAQAIMLLAMSSGKAAQNNTGYSYAPQPRLTKSDLPIARKHSLQRFLEKRKERLIAKAPYNAVMEEKPKRS